MAKAATKTFGILTSGGDCPGLNAAIRGVAKAAYGIYGMKAMGIMNGYKGLIDGNVKPLKPEDVSGILTKGGTILGTSREKPFKVEKGADASIVEKRLEAIRNTYNKYNLDCVVVLGGNGTHNTAALLKKEGFNIIGLPKTIDNDIYGTDITFGFHSAVDIATEAIDRLHSTAHSHNRVMVIEVMGHTAGWLALYSGVAGGGDVIILPEIPYDINSIAKHLKARAKGGKPFSIVVVAEGAISIEESGMSRKDLKKKREAGKFPTKGYEIAREIEESTGMDVRVSVLGYQQRGGAPSPYDRVIATQFGTAAAELLNDGDYGKMVARFNDKITALPLEEVAGRLKMVPSDHILIKDARDVGTCLGD
ncbi:MAG: ATP-dependent 6-phosphofructokinase [Bacillota bacterium]|nr:ATP-dependent 6-phosphofructokinase [Bacillota bacterium]